MMRPLRALALAATFVACSTSLEITGSGDDAGSTPDGGPGSGDAAASEPVCALAFDVADSIDFGESLLSQRQESKVTFTSFASASTTVQAVVTGATFSVEPASAVVAGLGSQSMNVVHQSAKAQVNDGEVTFQWGAGCSHKITLKAKTLDGAHVVSPGKLDLGTVACGTAPQPGKIIITAAAPGGNWTAAWVTDAGPFSLASMAGTLVKGDNTIQVQAAAVTPKENPHEETRMLTVSILGESPRTINVVTKSVGAVLGLSANLLRLNPTDTTKSVTISNAGNEPVQVDLSIASPFKVDAANPVTVAPGAPQGFLVIWQNTAAVGDKMLQVTAKAGTICAVDGLRVQSTNAQ
jgi:hypothetical protein